MTGRKSRSKPVKILYSLTAAAAVFGMGLLWFGVNKAPEKNAAAVMYFTDTSDVFSLSERLTQIQGKQFDVDFMENVSITSQVPLWRISSQMSVTRLIGSEAFEISLYDMENPSEAPLLLGTYLNFLGREFEGMRVISYCDMISSPRLPVIKLCGCGGVLFGTLFYTVFSLFTDEKKQRKKAAPKPVIIEEDTKENEFDTFIDPKPEEDVHDNEPQDAPEALHEFIPEEEEKPREITLKQAFSLGEADYSLPDGLESSSYMLCAKMLTSVADTGEIPVLVIAPANNAAAEGEISSAAKFGAYLACALAALGKRVIVIEGDVHSPRVSRIFNSSGSGGIAEIVSGKCKVWDALVLGARPGVDIIARQQPYPAPTAVFLSPSYRQFIAYMAAQYDFVLINAPIAWGCEEWGLLIKPCTGIIAVTENNLISDVNCAEGLSRTDKQTYFCSVKRPDKIQYRGHENVRKS